MKIVALLPVSLVGRNKARRIHAYARLFGPHLSYDAAYTLFVAAYVNQFDYALKQMRGHYKNHLKHFRVEKRGLILTHRSWDGTGEKPSPCNPTQIFLHRLRDEVSEEKLEAVV